MTSMIIFANLPKYCKVLLILFQKKDREFCKKKQTIPLIPSLCELFEGEIVSSPFCDPNTLSEK